MKLSKSFIFHIKRMKPRKNGIYSYTQQMLLIFFNDRHFIKGGIEFPHILQLLIRNGYNAILNKIIVKASLWCTIYAWIILTVLSEFKDQWRIIQNLSDIICET